MFPLASAGGRQLRRTNRLETKTGTTSRGAEGRILELGIAKEGEGEEFIRQTDGIGVAGWEGSTVIGTTDISENTGLDKSTVARINTGKERERDKKKTSHKTSPLNASTIHIYFYKSID